jgi:hypothetical protein
MCSCWIVALAASVIWDAKVSAHISTYFYTYLSLTNVSDILLYIYRI